MGTHRLYSAMKEETFGGTFLMLGLLFVTCLFTWRPSMASNSLEERVEWPERKIEKQDTVILELEEKVERLETLVKSFPSETAQLQSDALTIMEKSMENEEKIESFQNVMENLETQVQSLSDPPVSYICAYQISTSAKSSNVHYDSIFYSRTNDWTSEGGMDLGSGVYTAPVPGTYVITYSLRSSNDYSDNNISLYLRKNGIILDETRHWSDYYGQSTGYVYEQGGRTAILHLERGETVSLFCADCSAGVMQVMLCINLSQFDADWNSPNDDNDITPLK